MARYIVLINLTPQTERTTELDDVFTWEVRELVGDATSGNLLERSGPTLAKGKSADVVTAKHEAETLAELLAEQTIYIYNTTTQDPTPLPTPEPPPAP